MFETVLAIEEPKDDVVIKEAENDLDGLNYLAGKGMDFVNKSAMNGTILAHTDEAPKPDGENSTAERVLFRTAVLLL